MNTQLHQPAITATRLRKSYGEKIVLGGIDLSVAMGISDFTSKVIGDKRRWRHYKGRTRQLPENYRTAVDAIERYLMYFVPVDGDSAASMFEDLADLFERAAADGTPIRDIVGEDPVEFVREDPVEFVEAFVQNYSKGGYVPTRERERLTSAIERAEEEDGGTRS
jgi:DNA-binding ferritin-like protein (Dps family)